MPRGPVSDTPPIEIETGTHPTASVIWLHGLGADGHDFESAVPALATQLNRPTRFILPHAPYRPVSINNGYVMRAWYDMALSEGRFAQNGAHIEEAASFLHGLIAAEEQRGVESRQIVLAGFSQGGVIALVAGLTYHAPLAGIVALSPPLNDPGALCARAQPAQAKIGIFLAHGTHDSMVPVALGRAAGRALAAAGYASHWYEYPIDHAVCEEEIEAVARFLGGILA